LIDHDQHRPVLLQPGEDLAQRGFILGQLAVIDSFSRASQRASMVVALAHVQAEPDGIFGCRIDHSILPEIRPRSLELITTPAAGTHACKETWILIRPCPYQQSTRALDTWRQHPRIINDRAR